MTSAEIRKAFLDFFKSKGHEIVPSAPMVIKNDPTLMFTNAGMNQFKDIFLGNIPPKYKRVADTQKCLRVSGKHNDLEEVGVDTYHHTMFEMLGNWSFGDYFKKEAIEWAWELLTEVYKIPKDKLYVTIFEGDKSENLPFDEEAFECWKKYIDEDRILRGNKKDNFWEMGDTGPCGPCSEIHVDLRDDTERKKTDGKTLVNAGNPLVIEIWNNVFMEFNRKADGALEPLPAKHVDTGMGFERLCMVLQNKKSNYDTDVFQPLIQFISKECGIPYSPSPSGKDGMGLIAMRVMSDHIRAISFAIADGQLPSNNKAGYVIRRILRRAVRYGFTFLNFKEPFIYKLVALLAEQFKDVFPELNSQKDFIQKVIHEEEVSFLRTLETGIVRFEKHVYVTLVEQFKLYLILQNIKCSSFSVINGNIFDLFLPEEKIGIIVHQDDDINGQRRITFLDIEYSRTPDVTFVPLSISELKLKDSREFFFVKNKNIDRKFFYNNLMAGEFAFELYDTFGFPIDLTELIAREKGLVIDMEGFNKCLEQQKDRSRAAAVVDTEDWIVLKTEEPTEFVGYDELQCEAEIIKYRKVKSKGKEQFQIVLNKTPFYAESGGQVGDTGVLEKVNGVSGGGKTGEKIFITDTQKENNLVIHFSDKLPADVNAKFTATVNNSRRKEITFNHSATHLMHSALRSVLGKHVAQKGSLVNENVTRFDFSHFAKVTNEELEKIEKIVNEKVRENISLDEKRNVPIKEAMNMGAMALFGEKYGEFVRVITFDKNFSVELCGGTHVKATGQIGLFKIISESAVAAGVRRVEAITSKKAEDYIDEKLKTLEQIKQLLNNAKDPVKALQQLMDENEKAKKEIESFIHQQTAVIKNELLKKINKNNGINFISEKIDLPSADAIKNLSFDLKKEVDNLFLLLAAEVDGKAHLSLIISDNLVKEKKLDATKIIRELSKEIHGGGGGQAFYATAGGKNPEGIEKALEKVRGMME